MAVVVVAEIEGEKQEFFDQVSEKVAPDGTLPDGAKVQIAGPTENGWRVITVWDTEEQYQQFRNEKLIPALREAGGEDRIAPKMTSDPVYRLLTA